MNNEPDYDNLYFERKPMTQRIFDTDNAEDMALLWSILPDDAIRISLISGDIIHIEFEDDETNSRLYKINWHNKTEIERPIPLATKKDIGKICAFWEEGNEKYPVYAELVDFYEDASCYKYQAGHESCCYEFCRRLTKQEIEELC